MDTLGFSFKTILVAFCIVFSIIVSVYFQDVFRHTTRAVFCDVGQGDGAYIRTADKIDIVIDAGSAKGILTCLGRYMPFYDHTIELAFLSHPQKDHYGGYTQILERYTIKNFITSPLSNDAQSFTALRRKLFKTHTNVRSLYAGDSINLKNARINFIWPEIQYVKDHSIKKDLKDIDSTTDIFNPIGDLNDFSQVFVFTDKKTKILFTGDASPSVLDIISNKFSKNSLFPVSILKVPHHGSKNGLTSDFLQFSDPTLSVISVGKNNSYGHPSKEVIDFFKALDKQYVRTDEKGDVVIEISHKGWNMIE